MSPYHLNPQISVISKRALAKIAKVKRYEQRIKLYRQNQMFQSDQKKFYTEINNGQGTEFEKVIPDADESIKFWSEIWDNEIEHNREPEWLDEVKQKTGHLNQEDLKINEEDIKKQCKKISNWKAPGLDEVEGYWIKRITSCHQRIAEQLDEILNDRAKVPKWRHAVGQYCA